MYVIVDTNCHFYSEEGDDFVLNLSEATRYSKPSQMPKSICGGDFKQDDSVSSAEEVDYFFEDGRTPRAWSVSET